MRKRTRKELNKFYTRLEQIARLLKINRWVPLDSYGFSSLEQFQSEILNDLKVRIDRILDYLDVEEVDLPKQTVIRKKEDKNG